MKKYVKYILLGLYILSFIIVSASLIWIYTGDPPPLCTTLAKVFFVLWLICVFLLQFYIEHKKTLVSCKKESELKEQNTKCKFCDQLDWREYAVPEQNRMDTDNVCQCLSWGRIDGSDETHSYATFSCPENCGGCADENHYFSLFTYENRMGFSYHFKAKNFGIDRNSEMMTINFCPWCGRPLSEKIVSFEKSCMNFEMGSVMIKK